MKKYIFFGLVGTFCAAEAYNQGCSPIRSTGSPTSQRPLYSKKNTKTEQWTFTMGNRYFESFRHFRGSVEEKTRVVEKTEVINRSYTMDLNAVKTLNRRWSVSANLPVSYNHRSSLYEHGNTGRFGTQSLGIGDARLSAYRWMLNPKKSRNLNFQAGLGIKLPTGNYKVMDEFVTRDGKRVSGPVDQSIQLGDGGFGGVSEINAFYNINRKLSLYSNLYYLVNPRETNGVSSARGSAPGADAVRYGSDVMSVPDQYMARAGATVRISKFTFSLGARIDGVPAEDLVGGSSGFRRPGYVISTEPGLSFRNKNLTTFLNVPVALQRNRIQSVADKLKTEATGIFSRGDAAFADYVVNLGLSYSLKAVTKKIGSTSNQLKSRTTNKNLQPAKAVRRVVII